MPNWELAEDTPFNNFIQTIRNDDKAGLLEYLENKVFHVDTKDHLGLTPLFHAAINSKHRMVKELLKWGAYINMVCGDCYVTPLMVASGYGYVNVCVALLNESADMYLKDRYGNTARTWALRTNQKIVLDLFEEHKIIKSLDSHAKLKLRR